ncbi:MAG TPA: dihydrolipoyl dehydrogenase [Kosmotogaceae bacterium]|nr:MAG: Dihydrolipoamide dehydrogenase [Thermotogales bacterium 46_20]HAA84886.1 dihydrolipoyl dehydrogenase [Kosmotogaceae bacterium]
MVKFDVAVIGGGPGGADCAIRLAQYGKRTLLIEKAHMGGTCTNVGCIPTKAMVAAAKIMKDSRKRAPRMGISSVVDLDFERLMKHVNRTVTISRKGIESLLSKYGVEIVRDTAIYKDGQFILEKGGVTVAASKIVLATGSSPFVPEALNSPGIWTSDNVFSIKELPKSLMIVGAGYIGVEMASIFSAFGTEVTIVEMMNRLIPFEDVEASRLLEDSFKRDKIRVLTSSKVKKIEETDGGFSTVVETADGSSETVMTEKVLIAIGRRPVVPDGFSETDVLEKGRVVTDNNYATSIEDVYAIGDVRGETMLAHVASAEGVSVAAVIAGKPEEVHKKLYPGVIFCEPEIASVGVREGSNGLDEGLEKFVFPMSANGRANTLGERDGFAKIIIEKASGKIKGVSLAGPGVTELLMEAVIAINEGIDIHTLLKAVHPHPTICEAIKDAAEGVAGFPLHI